MDDYLRGLASFDPNGSLSNADADRIWASYKAAGGGRDVSASLPIGGGLPSGDGGRFTGARGMGFGSLGGGGLLGSIMSRMGGGGATPAVPSDGAMQPTIGPGAAPAVAPQAPVKMGLPPGGILGLLQGQSPQGLLGMLQRAMPGAGGAPLAGGMPQAGMLPGSPNYADPAAVNPADILLGQPGGVPTPRPRPNLPMNIDPMNQF